MIVGILSDTHDRVDATEAGLEVLRSAGAEFFIHCGDVGSEQILDRLAGMPVVFVFGNNDWDRQALQRYAEDLGITCGGELYSLTLADRRLTVTHGDNTALLRGELARQEADYLFTGHTHQAHDQRRDRIRWINPGALHRAKPKTVATLDLATDRLRTLPVVI